jgi:hypothetical protein
MFEGTWTGIVAHNFIFFGPSLKMPSHVILLVVSLSKVRAAVPASPLYASCSDVHTVGQHYFRLCYKYWLYEYIN